MKNCGTIINLKEMQRKKAKDKSSLPLLSIVGCVLFLAEILPQARTKTCPLLAEGNFYGPTAWEPDGSADEKTYYRYITDKDFVKLDSIYYCLD